LADGRDTVRRRADRVDHGYSITSHSWQIVGQRDFNGDGNADLLWSNTNGDNVIWLMNGSQVSQTANLGVVPSGWSVVGTGDFNGDGYGDILWRSTNGDTGIWLMTGTETQAQTASMVDLGVVPTSWTIAGTGDFNGDGYADILWRNSNGDTAIWLMTGTATQVLMSSTNDIGVVPMSWTVAVTGGDILWSDTDGDTAIWFMNGALMSSVSDLGNVPGGWIVQGAGAD
jgi:hypothetical protein